jgi:hypothetical protein
LTAERSARALAAGAALALVALVLWLALRPVLSQAQAPSWTELAPPPEVPMQPWRWILVVRGPPGPAHVRITEAAGAVRADPTAWWHLQKPIPGADASVVVRLEGQPRHGEEAVLAAICSALVGHVPTLTVKRITGPGGRPIPGIDLDRLRFLVRTSG